MSLSLIGEVCPAGRVIDVGGGNSFLAERLLDRGYSVTVLDISQTRAVFHFLTDPADRAAYTALLAQTVPVGGHVVIGTFALDGPEKCSGLEVRRYDGEKLAAELGPTFELLKSVPEMHVTPWGEQQSFQYSLFRRI